MRIADWDALRILADRNSEPVLLGVVTGCGYLAVSVSGTTLRFSRHPEGGWDLEVDNAYATEVQKRDYQYEFLEPYTDEPRM